jgi:hypothetical protein
MSSATQPNTPVLDDRPLRVVVISHSPVFYWWPVWAVGFLMAALTYWNGDRVAFVPPGTVAQRGARVEGVEGPRDVLIAPAGQPLPAESESDELKQPRLRMVASNNPGIVWALTLCLVIVITHIQLRGLLSLVVILIVGFATILLAILRLWDPILQAVQVIDIHLTAFSYLSISLLLLVMWLLAFFLFDRLVYMIFTPGQLRVRMAIGAGEKVFDTRGLVVEKLRANLFQHWLLGFGSGDLTVRTSGTNAQQFEMPNVLFIGSKLALINSLIQERAIVQVPR